jgi:twitching motility protein PilT
MMELMKLDQLFKAAVQNKASDLHIVVGSPPMIRVNGEMTKINTAPLTAERCQELCYSILSDVDRRKFEANKELDIGISVKNLARFRVNLFWQKGTVSGVFRRISNEIPNWQDLNLPMSLVSLTNLPHGLILVTGPTGGGKSTTIAALVDKINQEKTGHIVTIEDPIEYIHPHKNCIVNQRQIGQDSDSFATALKHLLRQDPDFVVVGELRDPESVDAALQIADTGHLVFGSLHTNNSTQTVNRLIDMFPGEAQSRIRTQLSMVLQGVASQQLLPAVGGGRVAAFELMLFPNSVRNLIRENKMHQLYSTMQMGQEKTGMRTMNQSLLKLLMNRKIELRVAYEASEDPEELDGLLKKAGL